jgi:hypothetical protein
MRWSIQIDPAAAGTSKLRSGAFGSGWQTHNGSKGEHALQPDAPEPTHAVRDAASGAVIRYAGGRTAEDVAAVGRIFGAHSYTASNVAKLEKWHGLLVGANHYALSLSPYQVADIIDVAARWFHAAHAVDCAAGGPSQLIGRFPVLMLDASPRASASQPHQHFHMVLSDGRFVTRTQEMYRRALRYDIKHASIPTASPAAVDSDAARRRPPLPLSSGGATFVSRYWVDFINVHAALGLAVQVGTAWIVVPLSPIKEREVFIIGSTPLRADAAAAAALPTFRKSNADGDVVTAERDSFGVAISLAAEALRDALGSRAISMGVAFEPFRAAPSFASDTAGAAPAPRSLDEALDGEDPSVDAALLLRHMPAVARLIDRGSPLDKRSDVGAMEFYGAYFVSSDPFNVAAHVRRRVEQFLAS